MRTLILALCLFAGLAARASEPVLPGTGLDGKTVEDVLLVDLNHDGLPEKLLGADCGNGGCSYQVLENLGGGSYKARGEIFLHRSGFEVLATTHQGFSDILSYTHTGADSGILTRWEFNGAEYVIQARDTRAGPRDFDLLRPTPGAGKGEEGGPVVSLLSLEQALSIARRHAAGRPDSIRGQHLESARLEYDSARGGRGGFWRIRWAWDQPRLGGEFGVRVYMDGSVEPEIAGP